MKMKIALGFVCIFSALASKSPAQTVDAANPMAGRWIVSGDFYGTPRYYSLQLEQKGDALSGTLLGTKVLGTVTGSSIHLLGKDGNGNTVESNGSLQGGAITGTIVQTDATDPAHPATFSFTATLVPKRGTAPPQRHEFTPTVFYRQYSALNKPALTVAPGDTIHTTTVDAGGSDEKSAKRVAGGNPETGPFYIETAAPGDTLSIVPSIAGGIR